MTVFDTDIITLLSYGQTPKLRERIEAVPEGEVLAVAVITLMQILGPRYDSIYKAADADQMKKATEGFRTSKHVLDGFYVERFHPASPVSATAELVVPRGWQPDSGEINEEGSFCV